MQTSIEYTYRDVPVTLEGTHGNTALIKINAVIVPVPIENLTKDIDNANQTTRIGHRERRDQSQEEQEEEKG